MLNASDRKPLSGYGQVLATTVADNKAKRLRSEAHSQVCCPDCGAKLKVETPGLHDIPEQLTLSFVEHKT